MVDGIEWHCLFCGKKKAEVEHIVTGSADDGSAICDECVGQALIVLASKGWVPPTIKLRVGIPDAVNVEDVVRHVEQARKVIANQLAEVVGQDEVSEERCRGIIEWQDQFLAWLRR
jgi:ATP-dependent protease Clp ATPase subunit